MNSLAGCNQKLTAALCHALASPDENQFFSPHGVLTILAMLYAGTAGQTKKEFEQVLWAALPDEEIHSGFEALAQRIAILQDPDEDGASELERLSEYSAEGDPVAARSDYGFNLRMANGIWRQAGYSSDKAYLDLLGQFYHVAPEEIDFADARQACDKINRWVEDRSGGLVSRMIGPESLPVLTRVILANVTYFKAGWATEFFDWNTSPEAFHNSDGSIAEVPMMLQINRFPYSKSDVGQIIELPYKRPEIGFTVFLPEMTRGGSQEQTDSFISDHLFAEREQTHVNLHIPKFKFDYAADLKAVLESIGLRRVFGDGAELSPVSDEPDFRVGNIIHKAFVSIDEIGTQAAAVSIGGMVGAAAAHATPPEEMKIDRPFSFFISDRIEKIVLFAGSVNRL